MNRLYKKIPALLNTDSYNRLEFTTPLDLVRQSDDTPRWDKAIKEFGRNYKPYLSTHPDRLSKPQRIRFLEEIFLAYLRYGDMERAEVVVKQLSRLASISSTKKYERLLRLMTLKEKEPPLPSADYVNQAISRWVPPGMTNNSLHKGKLRGKIHAYLIGHKAFEQKKYTKAINIFILLVKDSSFVRAFPQICYYLGASRVHKSVYPLALKAFQRYVTFSPNRIK